MARVGILEQRPEVLEGIARGYSETSKKLDEGLIRLSRELFNLSQFLRPRLTLARDGSTYIQEKLGQTDAQIKALLQWPAGWNGYDALAPNPKAVQKARIWAAQLFFLAWRLNRSWIQPTVSAGAESETVLSWWNKNKKLTIYISEDSAEYIRVWGPDIETEMSDGDAEPISTRLALWVWLTSD